MNKANECTCPSGDGSLVHPCPAHPAVEQVGGDERAAFEAAFAAMGRPVCRADYDQDAYGTPFDDGGWTGWQARAALAQPSPVRSSLLINGYQLRAALDFIAPDGTAEQLKSEACIEWRQQDADFLEAGLYAFCAEYPEEGGVLLDEEPTTAQPSPLQSDQAEAERPALWAVHAQGPDELYAAFSREDAEKHAAELNALPMPEGIAVGAVVVPSPWPEAEHWKYLAEQEQDHKNEIAGRLRQLERICEGLPQDAIDGGWTAQGIRGYAKRLEDQLKAALAQVEALRAELQSQRERNTELIFKLGSATNGWGRCEKERDAALARVAELERQQPVAWMHDQPNRVDVIHRDVKDLLQRVPGSSRGIHRPLDVSEHYTIPLYAAPVAQAQHSVPEISGIGRDAEHPRAVVLYLRNEPSEEDMRAIQNFLRAISADVLTQAQHSVPIAPQLKRALGLVVAALEADGDRPTSKYALSELKKVLAAAPGNSAQHSVPEGLALIPVRETEAMHDAVMALLYKGVARTDTQKLLDAYIAAAPGKEGA
ncbi:hypothetical protein K3176_18750 [Pseudomonas aeruginosa]|uniref:hypothetical protein n=1 Tax=Pseudomonas aeruginosa TaxID=287 RepID=UPI001C85E1FE|nr:hypothetical protein [Pseudomonas aeruginosa]QZD61525.1 hypothetical protein K3176_18750 [Pseudomonas aeruginosa]HCK7348223.1 hypothetical protein [Pseudomonas aeruginosa]